MNHHLSAALAEARVADLLGSHEKRERDAHKRQRGRVLASLVVVPAPAKPSHRRWA